MKTFRFYTGGMSYTDIQAKSKANAIEYFKREYKHCLTHSGRLLHSPVCINRNV